MKKSCNFAHAQLGIHWLKVQQQRTTSRFSKSKSVILPKSPILGLGLALGVGLGLGYFERSRCDYEALGRKTNRVPTRLATEIPNPVSDLT